MLEILSIENTIGGGFHLSTAAFLIIVSAHVQFEKLRAAGLTRYGFWPHDKTGRLSADLMVLEISDGDNTSPVVLHCRTAIHGGTEHRHEEGLAV